LTGCKNSPADAENSSADICTSSPYLQAAMVDLLGENNKICSMLSLAGAGMCPGHMDIRPSQIEAVRQSKVFVRFDFQAGLDEKFFTSNDSKTKIEPIRITGSLCEPESYLAACEQCGKMLIETGFRDEKQISERLSKIRERILNLSKEIRDQISPSKLTSHPILASPHQTDFCKFLGFDVLGTFTNDEDMSVKSIDRIVTQAKQTGVSIIVANAPEGRKMADVLASYLNARVVVFENFPSDCQTSNAFDKMVRENVRRLMEK
jgi:ABC-type Zn uptake system ZnuABC Zn-binding protein ZnuA